MEIQGFHRAGICRLVRRPFVPVPPNPT